MLLFIEIQQFPLNQQVFSKYGVILQNKKVKSALSGLSGCCSLEMADLCAMLETTDTQEHSQNLPWCTTGLIVPEILITHNYRYHCPFGLIFYTLPETVCGSSIYFESL
jgi:hypothetical protein